MKPIDKNENLGYLVNSTANALNRFMQRKIDKHHIDVPFEQLKLLMYISFNEGVNQQMICRDLNKAKPGISRLVDELVKKGLVDRQEDSKDRRNKLLFASKKGLEMRNEFYPLGRKYLGELEEELGADQSSQLKAHLVGIKKIILDKINKET